MNILNLRLRPILIFVVSQLLVIEPMRAVTREFLGIVRWCVVATREWVGLSICIRVVLLLGVKVVC